MLVCHPLWHCRGQGEALNIDRRDMYARLYACIPELALLPLQPDMASLHDVLSQGDVLSFDPNISP